jgi:hypothetical protein
MEQEELVGNPLRKFHADGDKVWQESLWHILSAERIRDAAKIVLMLIGALYRNLTEQHPANDDEEIVTPLFGRIYNDVLSGLDLALGGYVQPAFFTQRDIFECLCLLELFALDRSSIARWAAIRPEAPIPSEFRQASIRGRLDRMTSEAERTERKRIYDQLSFYAAHPNYHANAMLDVKGNGTVVFGPLFQEIWLLPFLDGLRVLLGGVVGGIPRLLASSTDQLDRFRSEYTVAINMAEREYQTKYPRGSEGLP